MKVTFGLPFTYVHIVTPRPPQSALSISLDPHLLRLRGLPSLRLTLAGDIPSFTPAML
jgi:hypothetical protein